MNESSQSVPSRASDAFDALLQEALEPISKAEPTPDFEQRLHLAAAPQIMPAVRPARVRLLRPAIGIALAATLLVTLALDRPWRRAALAPALHDTRVANNATPTQAHSTLASEAPHIFIAAVKSLPAQKNHAAPPIAESPIEQAAEEALPKLATFPSPDPAAEAALRPHHVAAAPLRGAAAQALVALEQQQAEPLTIADIHITPLLPAEKETPQ